MSAGWYINFVFGAVLVVCLLWRLLRGGLWRAYPYFLILLAFVITRNALLFAIIRLHPSLYRDLYWQTDTVDVAVRYLIIWEVFRHAFPKGSALYQLLGRTFRIFFVALVVLSLALFWSYVTYAQTHPVWAALGRSFSFTQALMILVILLAARYYGIHLGRRLQLIAIAFGAWASISTVNDALIDVTRSFLPYWRVVLPLSFVAMLAIWNWALWKESPLPQIVEHPLRASELRAWTENWNRTISSVRGVRQS